MGYIQIKWLKVPKAMIRDILLLINPMRVQSKEVFMYIFLKSDHMRQCELCG
jgi:hypothetical protein